MQQGFERVRPSLKLSDEMGRIDPSETLMRDNLGDLPLPIDKRKAS
jgi:hypothetical protein